MQLFKVFKFFSLIIICSISSVYSVSGKAKISGEFIGTKNIKQIELYMPIGSYFDFHNTKLLPVTDGKFSFELDAPVTVFMQMKTQYGRIFLIVSPSDNIGIKIYHSAAQYRTLAFEGSNAAGQYWYNTYNEEPLNKRISHEELFSAISEPNLNITFKKLGKFIGEQTAPLNLLYQRKQISAEFLSLAKTDLRAMHAGYTIERLTTLQQKISDKNTINKYQVIINALRQFGGPNKVENTRGIFGAAFLMDYYTSLAESKGIKNTADWGPYTGYKLAPDAIRIYLLGSAMAFGKITGTDEFDYNNAFNLYKKEFPKSIYLKFLNGLNNAPSDKGVAANVKFDTTGTYHTFDEIRQHYKGKAVYIDLWASWCMPCRGEFPYYNAIRPELNKKGIASVFISIDEPAAKKTWSAIINKSKLEGYHILANKALIADIHKVIYKNGAISIPRYIIINKNDKVINWDAPRPSDAALTEVISKL